MKVKFIELKKPWLGKFSGITLIPYVFWYIKNKTKKEIDILRNHELIHEAQVRDEIEKWRKKLKIKFIGTTVGWVIWYSKYVGAWIKNITKGFFSLKGQSSRQAYRNIPAEKEAYANENNLKYLETRKPFAIKNYL